MLRRLDYFLISDHLSNFNIKSAIKSDQMGPNLNIDTNYTNYRSNFLGGNEYITIGKTRLSLGMILAYFLLIFVNQSLNELCK